MSNTTLKGVTTNNKWLHLFTRVTVLIIAGGAAVLSFDALTAVAVASNIRPELAWVWAVVIDGFILVSTTATFALRTRSWREKWYPWTVLGLFVIFSVIANGWHAVIKDDFLLPNGVAVIVTAIPPLALFLAIHLLIIMLSPTADQKTDIRRKSGIQKKIDIAKEKALLQVGLMEAERIVKEAKVPSPVVANTPPPIVVTEEKPPVAAVESVEARSVPSARVQETVVKPASDATLIDGEALSGEAAIFGWIDEFVEDSGEVPTGKVLAQRLGSSERTGQNWLKRYRASKEVS